jgi:hypothetical protein
MYIYNNEGTEKKIKQVELIPMLRDTPEARRTLAKKAH